MVDAADDIFAFICAAALRDMTPRMRRHDAYFRRYATIFSSAAITLHTRPFVARSTIAGFYRRYVVIFDAAYSASYGLLCHFTSGAISADIDYPAADFYSHALMLRHYAATCLLPIFAAYAVIANVLRLPRHLRRCCHEPRQRLLIAVAGRYSARLQFVAAAIPAAKKRPRR